MGSARGGQASGPGPTLASVRSAPRKRRRKNGSNEKGGRRERDEGDPAGDAKVCPVHGEHGTRRVERRSRKEGQKARASEVPDMGLEAAGKKTREQKPIPDMGLEPMIFFACGGLGCTTAT